MSRFFLESVRKTASENLSKFRYHTGAQPIPVHPDEPLAPLFRDIGFEPMERFLRGDLFRLCGPTSPITYLRTSGYCEPYTDYGKIGRLMLLQPKEVSPWFSGIEAIYISSRHTVVDAKTMVFIPGDITLNDASNRFQQVRSFDELQEEVGSKNYAAAIEETLERLEYLRCTHAETERHFSALRRKFQSREKRDREESREWMQIAGLSEADLCTAWHHLPDERREFIQATILEMPRWET